MQKANTFNLSHSTSIMIILTSTKKMNLEILKSGERIVAPGYSHVTEIERGCKGHMNPTFLILYVKVSRHAYMKGDEIKISNHPILDSSDVFCVQGD